MVRIALGPNKTRLVHEEIPRPFAAPSASSAVSSPRVTFTKGSTSTLMRQPSSVSSPGAADIAAAADERRRRAAAARRPTVSYTDPTSITPAPTLESYYNSRHDELLVEPHHSDEANRSIASPSPVDPSKKNRTVPAAAARGRTAVTNGEDNDGEALEEEEDDNRIIAGKLGLRPTAAAAQTLMPPPQLPRRTTHWVSGGLRSLVRVPAFPSVTAPSTWLAWLHRRLSGQCAMGGASSSGDGAAWIAAPVVHMGDDWAAAPFPATTTAAASPSSSSAAALSVEWSLFLVPRLSLVLHSGGGAVDDPATTTTTTDARTVLYAFLPEAAQHYHAWLRSSMSGTPTAFANAPQQQGYRSEQPLHHQQQVLMLEKLCLFSFPASLITMVQSHEEPLLEREPVGARHGTTRYEPQRAADPRLRAGYPTPTTQHVLWVDVRDPSSLPAAATTKPTTQSQAQQQLQQPPPEMSVATIKFVFQDRALRDEAALIVQAARRDTADAAVTTKGNMMRVQGIKGARAVSPRAGAVAAVEARTALRALQGRAEALLTELRASTPTSSATPVTTPRAGVPTSAEGNRGGAAGNAPPTTLPAGTTAVSDPSKWWLLEQQYSEAVAERARLDQHLLLPSASTSTSLLPLYSDYLPLGTSGTPQQLYHAQQALLKIQQRRQDRLDSLQSALQGTPTTATNKNHKKNASPPKTETRAIPSGAFLTAAAASRGAAKDSDDDEDDEKSTANLTRRRSSSRLQSEGVSGVTKKLLEVGRDGRPTPQLAAFEPKKPVARRTGKPLPEERMCSHCGEGLTGMVGGERAARGHERRCAYRTVRCRRCDAYMKAKHFQKHKEETCPNRRSRQRAHRGDRNGSSSSSERSSSLASSVRDSSSSSRRGRRRSHLLEDATRRHRSVSERGSSSSSSFRSEEDDHHDRRGRGRHSRSRSRDRLTRSSSFSPRPAAGTNSEFVTLAELSRMRNRSNERRDRVQRDSYRGAVQQQRAVVAQQQQQRTPSTSSAALRSVQSAPAMRVQDAGPSLSQQRQANPNRAIRRENVYEEDDQDAMPQRRGGGAGQASPRRQSSPAPATSLETKVTCPHCHRRAPMSHVSRCAHRRLRCGVCGQEVEAAAAAAHAQMHNAPPPTTRPIAAGSRFQPRNL